MTNRKIITSVIIIRTAVGSSKHPKPLGRTLPTTLARRWSVTPAYVLIGEDAQ
jgi:hypothetical protein